MTLPTLSYPPVSQNQRVASYAIGSDEQPYIYDSTIAFSDTEKNDLIQAAYRQVFHEQHMLESYREPFLESQFRANQITTKDFVAGLAKSDSFRRLNYESNNNYRFVQVCIQRILGREVFNEREKIAWSIVIATQGVKAFISNLLNSEEYQASFGDSIVPYQRSRILPQREQGSLPFARMARYDRVERPELVTNPIDVPLPPFDMASTFDMAPLGDIGQGFLVAVLALLIFAVIVLVAGSASSFY
ncbi:MAG: phycobilisome rod-core linker polypeptide [Cyanobacteria bacterium P01_F01_bin.53]